MNNLANVTASAITPDQLLPYVRAVSGLESEMAGSCVLHHGAGQAVLVGYPINDSSNQDLLEEAIQIAARKPGLEKITVLSALPVRSAPENASVNTDAYWKLDLPIAPPKGKLANMLKRAGREMEITRTGWTEAHATLAEEFCAIKRLDEGTKYLFLQLGAYLQHARDAALFSAHDAGGNLKAFAIGDYSALGCAFYMFACRKQDAPPGTSDLLLASIIERAMGLGHSVLNLGLGINRGVGFFKQKWGAVEFLPCIETSWEVGSSPKSPWWKRIFRV